LRDVHGAAFPVGKRGGGRFSHRNENPMNWIMKWWKKALTLSIAWIVLIIGVGIIHTDVLLAGKITPQQDEAISEKYGVALAIGLVVIWLFAEVFWKRRKSV